MQSTTPWELPVEVIHPKTKHVVGRVYRDGLFIVFERLGKAYYDLDKHGTVMETSHGLHLRLSSESPSGGMAGTSKLLSKAIFDESLCGKTLWGEKEPIFTRMRLPCDSIMEYMSVTPFSEKYAEDESMTVKAQNFNRFAFRLPQIQARGSIEFTYSWSSKTFVEQKFTAQAALVLDYGIPVPLSKIKEHEERLRSFFDFIWFRGHKSGVLYLHDGQRLAMLNRRESISPEVRAADCLKLRDILTQQNLASWIERWFNNSAPVQMAIDPVVAIARNPGIITDMKLVMTIHALDALLKATKKTKGKAIEARIYHGLGAWWKMKRDLADEPLYDYIKRMIATRNLVLKASQHQSKSSTPILTVNERTKAYFECLLLHRALFLDMMNVEPESIEAHLGRGFGQIASTHYRYFND